MNKSFVQTGKWCMDGEMGYACSPLTPGLLSINMKTDVCKLIGIFPEKYRKIYSFSRCFKKCGKIICLPTYQSNTILFYDFSKRDFTYLDIPGATRNIHMWGHVENKNVSFVISLGLMQIIELDLKSEKIIGTYDIPVENGRSITAEVGKFDDYLLLMRSDGRAYITFNIIKKQFNQKLFEGLNDNVRMFCCKDDSIFILGESEKIYIWNAEESAIRTYKIESQILWDSAIVIESNSLHTKKLFSDIVPAGNKIFILPYNGDVIPYIDLKHKKVSYLKFPESDCPRKDKKRFLHYYLYSNKYLGVYDISDGKIYDIDIFSMNIQLRKIRIDDSMRILCTDSILYESDAGHRMLAQKFTPLKLWK